MLGLMWRPLLALLLIIISVSLLAMAWGRVRPYPGQVIFSYWHWTDDRQLFALDLAQHTAAPLTARGRFIMDVTVSPQTGELVYVDVSSGLPQLIRADASGRHPRPISNPRHADNHPAWSPDGRWIAFQSGRSGTTQLYLMAASGRADDPDVRQLTEGPFFNGEPAWSPDGRWLAFRSDATGTGEINLLELATGRKRQLTNTLSWAEQPAWSPDGQTLAFMHNMPGDLRFIILVDMATRRHRTITQTTQHAEHPAWLPDGRLLFEQIEGRKWLFVYDPARPGQRPRPLPIEWVSDTARTGLVPGYGASDDLLAIWRN